ncbi:MAG TPA: hypothetical protein VFD58_17890 [Blastocatellia bacterium]|nr:hypothetical protein [Blastocatellia bacterium]
MTMIRPITGSRRKRRLYTPGRNGPQLLVLADSAERIREFQVLLGMYGVEIIGITSLAEMAALRGGHYDVVVIDVEPAKLEEALRTFRETEGYQGASLLVAADRVASGIILAGLLPRFRAMPCGPAELRSLVRQRFSGPSREQRLML